MKDCYSVLRRQILEDVLGEKVEEYENFHKSKLSLNKRQHRKLIPLWKFLLHLLSRDKKSSYIEWSTERALEFRIIDTQSVAELWGSMKNKTDMTYEKLGRAMRYYYGKSIIEKVNGKRYSYRFILSRRTKKYISQFVNIKGMKIEPIDSRCDSPDHSNSDSASVGSTVGTSEEEESSLLYDAPSPTASPTSPTIPIEVNTLKRTANREIYGAHNTASATVQKAKVCIIKRNTLQSAIVPPQVTKRQVKIKTEFDAPVYDENQVHVDTHINRNQSNNDMRPDDVIDEKPIITSINIKTEELIVEKPAIQENQFCSEYINKNRNLLHTSAPGFYSRHHEDDIDVDSKKLRLSDEYDDSDLSSLTGSMSSEEFDHLEYIDIDYLEKDIKQSDFNNSRDTKKTGYQIVETAGSDVKLNRQIDPFMGCDFVRLTECDRSAGFDLSFNDIFEEYLF